jgi:cell division protein FtsQ
MGSNSDRRYGSSGDSRKRRSVYIGPRDQDRALSELRDAAARDAGGVAPEPERSRAGAVRRAAPLRRAGVRERDPDPKDRPASAAQRIAEERRTERELRRFAQDRAVRLRAVMVVAAVLFLVSSCVAVYRSPLFTISRVEVEGTRNLTQAQVRALARVPTDATLIRFPADAVAQRVGTDPWVGSVTVSRVFPDGMRIRVIERRAIAMVDAGTTFWLIDSTGMVLGRRSAEQTAATVVIRDVPGLDPKRGRRTTSEPLINAVRVLAGLSAELVSQLGSVSAPTVDGTTLYTRDRIEIVVGQATDIAKKDALVRKILAEQRGKVVSIDVRTTDRPTWRGLQK